MQLTAAPLLYLFCTCTVAFCRLLPIEPIEFSKSFENSTNRADRLRPPPDSALYLAESADGALSAKAGMPLDSELRLASHHLYGRFVGVEALDVIGALPPSAALQ
jgi:hypothetical protein